MEKENLKKYTKKKEKKKRSWQKQLVLIIVAMMMLGSVSLVLVERLLPDQTMIPKRIVSMPSSIVSFVMKPFQSTFSWIARGVTGYLDSWKLRKNIEIAYNELKAQNEELSYLVQQVEQLEEELEQFKTQWNIARDQYMDKTPILASVTTKETGNWFQKFTIDVGKKHGVEVNMAVVNEKGLIGYIDKVEETTSVVLTIIDSRAGVAGRLRSTFDQGMVHGTLGIDKEATCRMYYLPVDLVPRPGDVVETSGIGMPFPKGIPIGEVRESTRFMDQNKHYVVIEPRVDFMHIEKVMVLVYKPAQEDIPQANDGQISYQPSVLDSARPMPSLYASVEDPYLGAVTPPPRITRKPGAEEYDEDAEQYQVSPVETLEPDEAFEQMVRQEMMESMLEEGE